jgi:hypothetical protein
MSAGMIVSAGIGAAGTVMGAIKSAQERNRMKLFMENQRADNKAWFDGKMHSDYMQRKDTQSLMKSLRDNLRDANQTTASTAAVTGATPEQIAASKAATGEAITDTYSKVAGHGQAVQDNAEAQFLNRENQLNAQEYGAMEANAQSYENLISNSLNTGLQGVVSQLNEKK